MSPENALTDLTQQHGLAVLGTFAPTPREGFARGTGSVALLGPDGPGFWRVFSASDEARDGAEAPMDRWSMRVISGIAEDLSGTPLFPFGGPPYHPFYQWALRSGRCWRSPVGLLVHDVAGLMVSFRGAVALPFTLPEAAPPRPCDTCEAAPCLSACPASALGARGYDVPACHAYLNATPMGPCLQSGCLVRRACPLSKGENAQPAAQSRHHMRSFHPI